MVSLFRRSILPAALCLGCTAFSVSAGDPPPETFTHVINSPNASVTVDFVRRPIRSPNFGVIVQQADGSYSNFEADVPRTYLGTVRDRPGAVAGAILRANGTVWAQVQFETGAAWTTKGGVARVTGSGGSSPLWTTQLAEEGGFGSTVYAVESGFDITYTHFLASGGTPQGVVDSVEFSLIAGNLAYLRDAGIEHQIGKIVVRAHQAQDPYQTDGTDKSRLLQRMRSLWNAGNPMGNTHHMAGLIHRDLNGGLAYGGSSGVIGTSLAYSVSDSDNGDFWWLWRHEVGHNWGSGHTEGGGRTEGATIMTGDNALSRFSSAELVKIVGHRNDRAHLFQNLGPYPLPLPPRANLTTSPFLRNTPVIIDVMANDSDMNGDPISLLSFDATTNRGGNVSRVAGAGPGGRDLVLYSPPPTMSSGTDWFRYRIRDASGMDSVGFAVTRPRSMVLNLTDRWRLDDGAGTIAVNQRRASHNGTLRNGVLTGQPGATAATRTSMYFDGVDDRIDVPSLNFTTTDLTITAWIKRDGNQNAWAPVVMSRHPFLSIAHGFGFGTNNELRYHWANMGFSWQPSPALIPPNNEWCLVALTISPGGAEIFLRDSSGLQSARHEASHVAQQFVSPVSIGHDTQQASRHFKGWMDDVRIYQNTLNAADIESLYQQAVDPPEVVLTGPSPEAPIPGLDIPVSASVDSFPELVDRVDFVGDGAVVASSTSAPFQSSIPLWDVGERTLLARASYGDWGYQVDSEPVTLTIAPPLPPVVGVAASPPASKWGPTPGTFVFTRDHGFGEVTVSFTISGSAVAGVDFEPFPTTITFAEGELTKVLEVMPIEAAPDGIHESLTLTLDPGSGYSVGDASTSTLFIGDHATYTWVSTFGGSWNTASNWDSNPDLPVFGPDVVVDFSQVNITATRTLNLGSTGKIVGRLIFGDTVPSDPWDILAQNGPLTLQTTIGKPIIETRDWLSIITVRLDGDQGFEKTGNHPLRLDNISNEITGEILVREGALRIRNGSVNNPTVFNAATMDQRSLRVTGSGSVDMPRLGASGSPNITWSLPATTLDDGGTLRFRNNNAATYNHSMDAALSIGPGGGVIQNNGGSGVQNITLSGTLSGSGPLLYAADAGPTRRLSLADANNPFSGNWSVVHNGSGSAILRAAAANALGSGTVTLGNGGQLLNDHATGLDSLAGVVLDGTDSALLLSQPWNNPSATLAMIGGTPVAELGDAASSIGSLSGIDSATLQGSGTQSTLTVHQQYDDEFAGEIGPDLHLIQVGPARLTLSGALDPTTRLTAATGTLALTGEPAEITSITQSGGDLELPMVDSYTPPLTLSGDYSHTSGVLRIQLPAGGHTTGMAYPLIAYSGALTGQPQIEFSEPVAAQIDYGTGVDSVISVTFEDAELLTVLASPPEGGSVEGGGFYQPGETATLTAVPAPGWQFDGWEGEGVTEIDLLVATVEMDGPKTATAYFISDYEAWTRTHGLTGEDAHPDADPDGNGMPNELEFRFGFDPNDPNSRLRMSIRHSTDGDLVFTINRVIPEGTFTIQSSPSPGGPWEDDTTIPVPAPEWNHDVTTTMSGTARFYRLKYTP